MKLILQQLYLNVTAVKIISNHFSFRMNLKMCVISTDFKYSTLFAKFAFKHFMVRGSNK